MPEKMVSLPPEVVPIVSALMHMWRDLGTPEEVLEMILSPVDLDIETIETSHGTLRLLRPSNISQSDFPLTKTRSE